MRLVRRAVGFVVAPALSTIAACSLLTDFSGLTSGGQDAATDGATANDGAPPPPGDGGGSDAALDGVSADTGADAAASLCPPYELPATCDAKYLGDAKNCCIPGRDCQGGTCVNGKCQPVVIVADATGDARGIDVAGDWLVWATGCTHQVRRVSKTGAGNATLPAGQHCTPTLAAAGTQVYWIEWDGPNLMVAAVDGSGGATAVAQVPGDAGVRANFARLAVDGKNGYWAMQVPPSIWYASLATPGAHPTPLASAASAGLTQETVAMPYGVAVDANHVYWSDQDGNAIKRRTLGSLGQDLLAELFVTTSAPGQIALDAANVYWVGGGGDVSTHPKNGGALTILASSQSGAESVIVDDRYVYWTNFVTGGAVSRVAKTGGPIETLATGQKFPYSIAQDCTAIYFTNQADFNTGQIVKVVK